MAKKIYVGVSNIAKGAGKAYVGVNGIAKRIKKIYVGAGGTARLCYTDAPPTYLSDGVISSDYHDVRADGIPFRPAGALIIDTVTTNSDNAFRAVRYDGTDGTVPETWCAGSASSHDWSRYYAPTFSSGSLDIPDTLGNSVLWNQTTPKVIFAWDGSLVYSSGNIWPESDSKSVTISGLPFTPSGAFVWSSYPAASVARYIRLVTATADGSYGMYVTTNATARDTRATAAVSGNSITLTVVGQCNIHRENLHYIAW